MWMVTPVSRVVDERVVSNRVAHSTTKCTPFEVVYGFNSLTPIDLLPMPSK